LIEKELGMWREVKDKEGIMVAMDSSGIKIMRYSEWMRKKWGDISKKRRGWIKLHIVVDVESHAPLAIAISNERVGDAREFIPLIEACLKRGLKI